MGKSGKSGAKGAKAAADTSYLKKLKQKKRNIAKRKQAGENSLQDKANEVDTGNNQQEIPQQQSLSDSLKERYEEIPDGLFLMLEEPSLISRLFYVNPVCFLSTRGKNSSTSSPPSSDLNVMTLSWIMPCNNYGGFAFTIHKSRYSAKLLADFKEFVLSIATAINIPTLLAIGKCSGRNRDKFDGSIDSSLSLVPCGQFSRLSTKSLVVLDPVENFVPTIQPKVHRSLPEQVGRSNIFSCLEADSDSESESENEIEIESQTGEQIENHDCEGDKNTTDQEKNTENRNSKLQSNSVLVSSTSEIETSNHSLPPISHMAINHTIAHIPCRVLRMEDAADEGHWLVVAQADKAWVHPSYWNYHGKCLIAKDQYPPVLTFLGSQHFGGVHDLLI